MDNKDLKDIPVKVNMIISINLIGYQPIVRFMKIMETIRFKLKPLAHNLHRLLFVDLYLIVCLVFLYLGRKEKRHEMS